MWSTEHKIKIIWYSRSLSWLTKKMILKKSFQSRFYDRTSSFLTKLEMSRVNKTCTWDVWYKNSFLSSVNLTREPENKNFHLTFKTLKVSHVSFAHGVNNVTGAIWLHASVWRMLVKARAVCVTHRAAEWSGLCIETKGSIQENGVSGPQICELASPEKSYTSKIESTHVGRKINFGVQKRVLHKFWHGQKVLKKVTQSVENKFFTNIFLKNQKNVKKS